MTLQDYISLVTISISNYSSSKSAFVIPTIAALIIFLVGLITASLLKSVWLEISKFLSLEKSLSRIKTYSDLAKVNKNLSISELLGSLIWWTIILIFLIPALKAVGIRQIDTVLANLFNYIPVTITAGLYLLIGSLVAWYSHLFILAIASLIKIPTAELVAKIIAFGILIFSSLLAIKTLGVSAENLKLIAMATIAAAALSFGLAGKDIASGILKKSKDLIK